MPILVLTEKEIPRLLEFYDHRSREGAELCLLSQADGSRAALAALPSSAFAGGALLGVEPNSQCLIRGLVQYRANSASAADVAFVVDKSIESLAVTSEMLAGLIDGARAAGITRLDFVAEDPSTLLSALRSSGWPLHDGELENHRSLNILSTSPSHPELVPATGGAPERAMHAGGVTDR